MEVIIQLPIRTYLKKFLAKHNEIYPFVLAPSKCHISAVILESLSVPDHVKWEHAHQLNDTIEIVFNSEILQTHDFTLSNDRLKKVDQYLRSIFLHTFGPSVSLRYEQTGDIFRGIRAFMDYYNIEEDDIMFETLVKDFYRFRKKPIENKVIKKMKSRRKFHSVQPSLFD